MSVTCPNCGSEFEPPAVSEAVPYENMQAAPGAILAADEGGEVTQSYATPEQLRAQGLRPFKPGTVPKPVPTATMVALLRQGARR